MPEDGQKYGVKVEGSIGKVRIEVFMHNGESAVDQFKQALGAVKDFRDAEKELVRAGK